MRFMSDNGEVEVVQFDGYGFGETILEGVKFQAKIVNGQMQVWVREDCKAYMARLNQKKWLKEAKEFAEQNDIFEIPDSDEEAWLEED